MDKHNLDGKIIIPFCTSHSSGIGSSDTDLHCFASKAGWKPGKRFSASEDKSNIENWIESLNLLKTGNKDSSGTFNLSEGKNGFAPTVRLSSGYDMPIVGLGTYSLTGDVCVSSVKSAIAAGFRKIDTAYMYGNEVEVGKGVRESEVPSRWTWVSEGIVERFGVVSHSCKTQQVGSAGHSALEFATGCGCYSRFQQSRPYEREYFDI